MKCFLGTIVWNIASVLAIRSAAVIAVCFEWTEKISFDSQNACFHQVFNSIDQKLEQLHSNSRLIENKFLTRPKENQLEWTLCKTNDTLENERPDW